MHVYGPAGETKELGIEALVENVTRLAAWHDRSKIAQVDPRGFELRAHEF